MKFSDIMFIVGLLCIINALCLWWCFSISGWVICKILVVVGVNCLALAFMTLQ